MDKETIKHSQAKQTAKQFDSLKFKCGYLDIEISGLTIVLNFCLLMLLLAHSVTPSPWGRGNGVGCGQGPGCFLRSLCCLIFD